MKPKYSHDELVIFKFDDKMVTGRIVRADIYPDAIEYDIYCEEENMLYKHFPENVIYDRA